MYDLLISVRKSNNKAVTQQDGSTASVASSSDADRAVGIHQVHQMSRWKKPLMSISVRLAITTVAVSTIEYPSHSTAIHPATLGSKIDRLQPSEIATSVSKPKLTPVDRPFPVATMVAIHSGDREAASTAVDRRDAAKAAVKDAKLALALSQADVAQARINTQTFKQDYDRYQDLSKRGLVNPQQLARAKHIYNFAKLQNSYALHGLKIVQSQLAAAEVDAANGTSDLCPQLSASK